MVFCALKTSIHAIVVPWRIIMRTHNTGVVSSTPPCVTLKTPLVGKTAGNHLMNSTSLEKTQSPVSGLFYVRNRVCNAVLVINAILCFYTEKCHPPIPNSRLAHNSNGMQVEATATSLVSFAKFRHIHARTILVFTHHPSIDF